MCRALLALLAAATALWANPETTVQLPGGATMDFVWIEPGTFTMGSGSRDRWAYEDEKPAHEVTLTRGYWLGKCEVTQGQWSAAMGTEPWLGRPYVLPDVACPAVFISWDDCQDLCAALSVADEDAAYRLPTEAEWEYACRAGTTTRWHFGDDESLMDAYDWYSSNAWGLGLRHGQPVGLLLPNPWGLHDMHGNVNEWVHDWYGPYPSAPQTDPVGPETGEHRAFRSSCVRVFQGYGRSANRMHSDSTLSTYWVGVRVVREGAAPGTAVTPTSFGAVKREARGR